MSRITLLILLTALSVSVLGQQESPPLVRGAVELHVRIDARQLAEVDADVVVVPVFEDEDILATTLGGPARGLSDSVALAVAQGVTTGRLFNSVSFFRPQGMVSSRLLLIGAGRKEQFDAERLRRVVGFAVREIMGHNVGTLAVFAGDAVAPHDAVSAATEGAYLGLFDMGIHKSGAKPTKLESLNIAGVGSSSDELERAIQKATLMAQATNFARSLVIEPANYVTPKVLAAHAQALSRDGNLEVEIFDDEQMEQMGMGGVLAVGKGSVNRPRFIVLRHRPNESTDITLALIGKGVCFDSGGISIKGRERMYRQKGDMAGGAAVLGAMKIIAGLRPKINVLGIVPAVENMPGPYAQKPGDVFVGYSGKTVEVMSTDAEGRLILSDGISYALEQGATHLVDVATLTGTVRRALGDRHVGALASDDAFYALLVAASRLTGESFWRLPIDEEYARGIKSSMVADLNETGGIVGASIGAKFLQQFTEGKPWIHLDIAGTSWPDFTPPYRAPGPTGVTVRTLAELALTMSPH